LLFVILPSGGTSRINPAEFPCPKSFLLQPCSVAVDEELGRVGAKRKESVIPTLGGYGHLKWPGNGGFRDHRLRPIKGVEKLCYQFRKDAGIPLVNLSFEAPRGGAILSLFVKVPCISRNPEISRFVGMLWQLKKATKLDL
jgi:hypothetical protein